jgi:molecular chaperone GrpE
MDNIDNKEKTENTKEDLDQAGSVSGIIDPLDEKTASDKKKPDKKHKHVKKEEELQLKLDELNDKYLRLYSEFDNYRKRTIKEKLDITLTASEDVIIDLLPVLDDFERAVKSSGELQNCDTVKEGITLIQNKFKSILEKKGLKPMETAGMPFDTDFHEAIAHIPAATDDMKGKVVDEIEKGYLLNEKVIRYAKVVIGQ